MHPCYFALAILVVAAGAVIYFAVSKHESPESAALGVEQDVTADAAKVEQAVITEAKKVEVEVVTAADDIKAKI